MLIQFLNAPDFAIGEDGAIRRSARWLLASEAEDGDFTAAAMLWAGRVHDDWRVPNRDGDGYTTDATVRIAQIDCRMLDGGSCEIHYTGVPRVGAVTRVPGAYRLERRASLEEYYTDVFQVPAEALANFLPAVGDPVEWHGVAGCCVAVSARQQPDGSYCVEMTAVGGAVRQLGEITGENNAEFASVKRGVWLVTREYLEDFLSAHPVHGGAADWAGEGFYIFRVNTELAEGGRTKVTLLARHAELRLIESTRQERLLSCADASLPEKEIVWVGRWQVPPEDCVLFANRLGSDASAWSEAGFVVSKITPKRISDCEYEYVLEARLPETITPSGSIYWRDRDWAERLDFRLRIGEMRLSALQCGYCWNYHGQYTGIRQWDPAVQCPLATARPLNPRWINQNLRLVEMVCVAYLPGASATHVATLESWLNSNRIVTETLAGVSAAWLKVSIQTEDVFDSRDRRWTKVTKVYRKPPAGFAWNPGYWI